MNNLAFHITDISSNSVRAGATHIILAIQEQAGRITIRISDNGCGMDAETISRVSDPFYTTRLTRKVGLGIPFLIQNAEQTGGYVTITSNPGKGTVVTACFISDNIDCPPWGDLAGTVAMLITGNPGVNFCFLYQSEKIAYSINTEEIEKTLDGIPISLPEVILFIKEMIHENIRNGREA